MFFKRVKSGLEDEHRIVAEVILGSSVIVHDAELAPFHVSVLKQFIGTRRKRSIQMAGALDDAGRQAPHRDFTVTARATVPDHHIHDQGGCGRWLHWTSQGIGFPEWRLGFSTRIHARAGKEINVAEDSKIEVEIPGVGTIEIGIGWAVKNILGTTVIKHHGGEGRGNVPRPQAKCSGRRAGIGGITQIGVKVMVIAAVNLQGDALLPQVTGANGPAAPFLGLGQGWQQHGGKDGNDCNDHQQLNEGEGLKAF